MNKLNNILLLLGILISLCNSASSSYIVYSSYNYDGVCPGQPPQSPVCNNDDSLLYSMIYPLSTCINFNTYFYVKFSISQENTIIESIYGDQYCKGPVSITKEYTNGECNSTCVFTTGTTFSLSIANDFDLPSNSYLDIYYGGECNDNFKNDLIQIQATPTSKCINYGVGKNAFSKIVTCNDNTSSVTTYSKPNCAGSPSHFSQNTNVNQCSDIGPNHIQLCN